MKKSVAGPASDEHDHENGAFSEVHSHRRTRSNRVRANVLLFEPESRFAYGSHRVSECINDVVGGYIFYDSMVEKSRDRSML